MKKHKTNNMKEKFVFGDESFEQHKDFVLLMLGAPVITVDLSDEELNFCIQKPYDIIIDAGLVNHLNTQSLNKLLQRGAIALGEYIVSKKRFRRNVNSTLFSPDEDGFASMTNADLDWDDFLEDVERFRKFLKHED